MVLSAWLHSEAGLSEYKKNYKWKGWRSPSPEHRAPWAGLCSDQLGITKEPSFISKKRVPHDRPQISRSFQWVNRVLQKKAGLKTDMRRSLVYNRNKEVPPFKSGSFVRESKYQRNFKSSPPPKELSLRTDLEEREAENISPTSNSKVSFKILTRGSKLVMLPPHLCFTYSVKELRETAEAYRKRAQGTHFSREHLNQILSEKNQFWEVSSSLTLEESASEDIRALDLARTMVLKRSPSPARSGSCSPVQSDTSARKSPSDDTEKASLHSGATLPVRRLAWGEEENEHEEQETLRRREGEQAQEEKQDEQEKEWFKCELQVLFCFFRGKLAGQKSSARSGSNITPVSSDLSNKDEGRLPTPEMKNQGGAPRTHHDLTTPTVGGALLVSPPKLKPSPKQDLQTEPLLGKPYSPHQYLCRESAERTSDKMRECTFAERTSDKVDVAGPSRSSIAAGLKTSDPLPLREDPREDSRLADSPPAALRTPSKSSNSTAPKNTAPASLSPHREAVSRIQGSLRDPEFQHNGNIGGPRPGLFRFSSNDSEISDNDDGMSQISARSAASSSLASLILERTQKRKHNFWGKS
ncbi:nuclear protein MDM1-like [Polyodon spathula]|uniref:nuclear protein MDM1-like n=1 Tax=Polyodon spathula TaxID=7913 RepID=UPI001B7F4EE4|nr:nuclear protein MDM1-like [Polyodon spathula]